MHSRDRERFSSLRDLSLATPEPRPHAAPPHWAQWRGPDGLGIAKDPAVPLEWSATKNVVWGNTSGQMVGNGITYTANTVADPRFVNRAGGDFHVQTGSPAIDFGQVEYALPDDLDGAARPQGSGPDSGSYER